jgi:hypothetical protein
MMQCLVWMLFWLLADRTLTLVNGLFRHIFPPGGMIAIGGLYLKSAKLKMDDS